MSFIAWRLRAFAYRAIPHTLGKRLGYGAALLAALGLLGLTQGALAAVAFGTILLVRWIDVRRGATRRRHLPMSRAYFFEGDAEEKPRPRPSGS